MQKITFDTCHIGHNKLLLTYYSYRWFSLWLKQYFNIVICIQYDFWVLLQHWACVPVFICVAMLDHQVEILNFEGTDRRCNQAQTCYWSSCFWPCFCQYLWLGSTLRRISASFEERDKKKKRWTVMQQRLVRFEVYDKSDWMRQTGHFNSIKKKQPHSGSCS